MVQPENTFRIDKYITTSLGHITPWLFRPISFCYLLQIYPQGFCPPNIPEGSVMHAIFLIYFPTYIDKQRPYGSGFLHILLGKMICLKGDNYNLDVMFLELLFMFPQLREMDPAGQSTEVAVKNHQQPTALIILKLMCISFTVCQTKENSWLAGHFWHESPLRHIMLFLHPSFFLC